MPSAWGFLVAWIAICLSTSICWKTWQDWAIDKEKKGRNFQNGNYSSVGDPAIITEADVTRGKDLS